MKAAIFDQISADKSATIKDQASSSTTNRQITTTTKRFSTKIVVWNVSTSSKTMKSKQTINKKKESNDTSSSVELHTDLTYSSKATKKNKVNKLTNENDDLVFKPSRKCEFNPCQNDGSCYLLEPQRFTCVCKDFYYGVYCEHSKLILSISILKKYKIFK